MVGGGALEGCWPSAVWGPGMLRRLIAGVGFVVCLAGLFWLGDAASLAAGRVRIADVQTCLFDNPADSAFSPQIMIGGLRGSFAELVRLSVAMRVDLARSAALGERMNNSALGAMVLEPQMKRCAAIARDLDAAVLVGFADWQALTAAAMVWCAWLLSATLGRERMARWRWGVGLGGFAALAVLSCGVSVAQDADAFFGAAAPRIAMCSLGEDRLDVRKLQAPQPSGRGLSRCPR